MNAALKPLQIFRPGKHQPMKGDAVAFSEADVQRACEVYDPALYRAPLVVGHPATDAPAFGHVRGLRYAADKQRAIAEASQVDPAFAEWVASGRLLSVSASWYTPTAPNNPVPGSYYLRHVGFLGAQPPAVKGLEPPQVAFADDEEGVLQFTDEPAFSDWAGEQTAGLFARLRDWLISSIGLEKADQVLPSWSIDSLKREAITAPAPTQPAQAGLSYGDPTVPENTQEQLQAQAAQLERDRADLAAREAAIAQREHAQRRAGLAEFAERLVQAGRLLPAERAGLVELMASLPDQGAELSFAEADGAAVKRPPLEVLQGFLQGLPPRVDFSERAGGAKDGAKDVTAGVDMADAQAIAAAALEFQEAETKAGRTVSLEAAVQHIKDHNEEAA